MSLDLDPSVIWRDFTTDGIPASGKWDPRKVDIRQYESAVRQAVIALLADADPGLQLPNLLIRATDAGAGTPNAIQATTNLPVPTGDASALIALNLFEDNTASPVTVSFNGGTALTVKTNSGNDVVAGGLAAGMMVLGVKTGSIFRLFSDQASAAILAAAEDAADRAEAAEASIGGLLGSVTPIFPSVAAASAHSPDVASGFIQTAGYSVPGDGGGALYVAVSNEPGHLGKFSITLADGETVQWYEIASQTLRPIMFGAVGDDTTDDTYAWQSLASVAGGKRIEGDLGAVYNINGEVVMPDHVHLDLRGARMNFRESGSVYHFRPGSYNVIENGAIKSYGTALVSGDYQCPMTIGRFTANVTVHDIVVRNMWLDTDMPDGNAIIVTGASYNILIENITTPDSTMFCPVLLHWGGTPDGTGHPHDVVIRNIVCGNIDPDGYLVSVVSSYNVLVENVYGKTCGKLVHYYAGDYTNTFASADVAPLVCTNVIFRNMMATEIRNKGADLWGHSYNPDIVPGTPITSLNLRGVVENCRFYGRVDNVNNTHGVRVCECEGVDVRNNVIVGFRTGVVSDVRARRVRVQGNLIQSCLENGISAANSVSSNTFPEDWLVEGNKLQGNNRLGLTSALAAAINVGTSRNIIVKGNRIGFENTEFSYTGVSVQASAVLPVVEDNYVQALAASGIAFNMFTSARGRGNRAASGITLHAGSPITDCLVGSIAFTVGELAAGARTSIAVTVTGAAVGDMVEAVGSSIANPGLLISATIEGADIARIWFMNMNNGSAVTTGASMYTVYVRKRAG